jgi:N-acetylglucosamine-6-phosphate deacetylase
LTNATSPDGLILTPSGWVRGRVVFDGDIVSRIEGVPVGAPDDATETYILPGFVDLHVHGGAGYDFTSGEEGIRRFISYHARHGTTAIAPTTATAPVEVIERSLRDIEVVRRDRRQDEPHVLGAHLEGPFINPGKLGAQLDLTLLPDIALANRWAALCPLVVATIAPEMPGGLDLLAELTRKGCRVQIGHSLATAEEAAESFAAGMAGFTHLFNGMSGMHHREPGVAAYALAHGRYAELICDLTHVHAALVMAAYRAIPRLYAITDAVTHAGLPDGTYDADTEHPVVKNGTSIMLADGSSLAGSAITMLDAFRNLVSIGLTLKAASELCSTRQAEYLSLDDCGRIAPGSRGDLVVLGRSLELDSVWIRGRRLQS